MPSSPVRPVFHQPSFAVLRSFECAARHESFTLASRELNLTQSAVSRQIRSLEEETGLILFRRIGRQVQLTEAGRSLAEKLTLDLENVRETLKAAMAAGNDGAALRVAALPTFSSRWLIPRLADFERQHPGVAVNLITRTMPFDLGKDRVDLVLHFGQPEWAGGRLTTLCDEKVIAVSSPNFMEKSGFSIGDPFPETLPLIHLSTRLSAWSDWYADEGLVRQETLVGYQFDQFSMVISAALASLGAALIPDYLIERELKTGQLVRLSDRSLETDNSYYIVQPVDVTNPHAEALKHWMISQISTNRPAR